MKYEKEMQYYFTRLDKADGEVEITAVITEMDNYIDNIKEDKERSLAEQSFKYYFTKRLSRLEDSVKELKRYKKEHA